MIKLNIDLDITDAAWKKAFAKIKDKIEQAATCAFMNAKKPAAFKGRSFNVGILLTNDRNVKMLNRNYRGKDKSTNVLSFPQIYLRDFRRSDLDVFPAKGDIPLGDVVLALQTIKREAKEQEKTLESHVVHLVVHGTLHLLGYDHMKLKDAKTMEKLECDILSALGYPDPYAQPAKKSRR